MRIPHLTLRSLFETAAMAAIYFAISKFSLGLAFQNPSVSPVWPPTGFALAMILLFGMRLAPAIFIGAFFANVTTSGSIETSIAIACGNTAEAVIGTLLIEKFANGRKSFYRVYGMVFFVACCILATAVSATIGVTALEIAGFASKAEVPVLWSTWWLGDLIGALIVTPMIVLVYEHPKITGSVRRIGEGFAMFLSIVLVGGIFTRAYPLTFLSLLPILWAAIRFGPRDTSMAIGLTSILAIVGALNGVGPFSTVSANLSLLFMQSFMGVVAVIGLILAAAMHEKKLAMQSLEQKVHERTGELEASLAKDSANLHRLEATIAHLPMAALLMDEKGNVLEINNAYCTMFNINLAPVEAKKSPDELMKRFRENLLNPDEHIQSVMSRLERKEPIFDEEILLKDGRIILRHLIFIYEQNTHRGQLFLYRDVTKERRADRAKSEFMSLASHQLRTPITTIRWILGRLKRELDEHLSDPHKELLVASHKASVRMAQTIDTMLRISQLEAQRLPLSISEVNLFDVFQDKEILFRPQYQEKHQSFTIDCPEHLSVKTDAIYLKEILKNLLQNAVKYTPDGGKIILRAYKTGTDGVRIQVEDTGYGIPGHQQKHVFRKFFRGDNVVTLDTDGTGLGLYLVSLLTNLLGGSISVESEEKKGTIFTLELPPK